MSSSQVRTLVNEFLAANSEEVVIDITGHYEEQSDLLHEYDVQPDSPFMALEFVGDDEVPVSLSATNDKGLYRETGSIRLHICAVAKLGVGASLVSRAESLRNLFRGRNIGGIIIESVSPVNTGPGATLEFSGGYVSGSVSISYHMDLTPTGS